MIKPSLFVSILLSIILLTGCSTKVDEDEGKNNLSQPKDEKLAEDIIIDEDPILTEMKNMTLDEKIGQMVMAGVVGHQLDDNTIELIEKYKVSGFILFERNIKDSDGLLHLINSLKEANRVNNTPLFISIDEEGGRVSRLQKLLGKIPSSRKIGKIDDEEFSYAVGNTIGKRVKGYGINMNFAPVLDIDSNPQNPVIGDRAFGSNEAVVSKHGIKVMKGIKSTGVIPVVKHFPGHGDTLIDSHDSLPAVDKDLNQLLELELVPFKAAINNDTDAIMIAHIKYNKIDLENPATLSPVIITDILRKQLNFNGLIITDDMTMGAIIETYHIGEAAVKSVKAGSDIVLVCHEYENWTTVINYLKDAVKKGEITPERINESVYRILKLKNKYMLTDKPISNININEIINHTSELLKQY
ncbi:beta-N-acetylhexosaminidase [Alkaliphilus pronyensis]|uniref:Beta-N-acetylhexosaminidase n=1 Tax=Alkaliphilus pronyensis TaxID=1482732 RepID=A0A6I0F7V5_9FIRM|nr:beta-N-acetylhexosaminidase [Alkaliphilus pronyensis]KAB3536049.1 beta-N-acetylhexosaminidase [Alkaliphilus pronyensis]